MARILCVDTFEGTVNALRLAGHHVDLGSLGYVNGIIRQPYPPHEYDLIVCDLRQPACYDVTYWGPGKNDNFKAEIVKTPKEAYVNHGGRRRPVHAILRPAYMKSYAGKQFLGRDIATAVAKAGVPVAIFLNHEWMRHVDGMFPMIVAHSWDIELTRANKVDVLPALARNFPEFGSELEFLLPLQYKILGGSKALGPLGVLAASEASTPVITNNVGDTFGCVTKLGQGHIWLLPAFRDNGAAAQLLAERIQHLGSKAPTRTQAANVVARDGIVQSTVLHPNKERDLFFSHASEDKDFARSLVGALVSTGISVWFDEYEIKLGDSIRRSIERGLANSRHGLVLLSPSFFAKKWTNLELDALISMETETRRILPLWHDVSRERVAEASPLLADKYAIATDSPTDAIVQEIMRAIRQ